MKLPCFVLLLSPLSLWCGNTTVVFQPNDPAVGPFPSNSLTIPATNQATGVRVNLPVPAVCTTPSLPATPPSTECFNVQQLNQLDGFSLNPRIMVCFSGPVDTSTLRAGIFILDIDGTAGLIGINQVIYDSKKNCAYAKPDQVLNQQSHYLLAVTSGVRDLAGAPVVPASSYTNCLNDRASGVCQSLTQVIQQVIQKVLSLLQGKGKGNLLSQVLASVTGNQLNPLVAATMFTTMSATSWLQKAQAQVNSDKRLGTGTLVAMSPAFDLTRDVTSITWMPDTGDSKPNPSPLPMSALAGVDRVAFGAFNSQLYLNDYGFIETTPTGDKEPIATPRGPIPVSFHVFLPKAGSNPSAKIPVIIYGHGMGDNQYGAPTFAAATWARKGFATIAMEIPGHGFGPGGSTQVVTNSAGTVPVPTPGRGILLPNATSIGPSDGCIVPTAIATRDCSRQTAVDLFALIRTIRSTNGLNLNLDPTRIYYVGQSFGTSYGTLFGAVEPSVSAVTLNSGGGTQADIARLSPVARQIGALYLSTFMPPLLNTYNPADPNPANYFNDEYVFRDQDAVTDKVPGALSVQAAFEAVDWLGMVGDPISYAAHLKSDPLNGAAAKPTLVQFGLGDLEVPNPAENAMVRAGGFESATWVLRTDAAARIDPRIAAVPLQPGVPYPIYPHRFLSNPVIFDPANPLEHSIAMAAQSQVADFFASGGAVVPDPNQYLQNDQAMNGNSGGKKLFDKSLPAEGLNFLP